MPEVHLRNIESGAIKVVDTISAEFAKLKGQRTKDDRFPLYEQTGAHDADPEHHASTEEVSARSKWGVQPLSDVTADGVGQSDASAAQLSDTSEPNDEKASTAKAPAEKPAQ
jgi:hypothetical protein